MYSQKIKSLPFIYALLMGIVFSLFFTPQAQARKLSDIFVNLPRADTKKVRAEARRQARSRPKFKSTPSQANLPEIVVFQGYFRPASDGTKMAVLSDDGVRIYANGRVIHNRFKQGQTLEYVDKADKQSFHTVEPSGGWRSDTLYAIRVEYSNIEYTGSSDTDGCTLFAYNGGGNQNGAARTPEIFCKEDKVIENRVSVTVKVWSKTSCSSKAWVPRDHTLYVRRSLAPEIRAAFEIIYNAPLRRRKPIKTLGGFNFRCARGDCEKRHGGEAGCRDAIEKSHKLCLQCISGHANGMAIDVNETYNWIYRPPQPNPDEQNPRKACYTIQKGDVIYNTFARFGWEWGGDWVRSKDYMHFSKDGR